MADRIDEQPMWRPGRRPEAEAGAKEIDQVVYGLYGLTTAEVAIVEASARI